MSTPAYPPVQRRRKARDLSRAEWLRPRDVFEIYGIPASTLGDLCRHPNSDRRLTSSLIQGKNGRKGVRLVRRSDLEAYLAKHSTVEAA